MTNPTHHCFTVASTSYLRNLDREDLRAECIAILYQDPPTEHENGSRSIGLRFPMLIVAGYLEQPRDVAERVAAILEKHWHDADAQHPPEAGL